VTALARERGREGKWNRSNRKSCNACAPWRGAAARPRKSRENCFDGLIRSLTRLLALKYLREAFALSLRQVGPLGGWSADGTGELSDSQLNALLQPEIEQTRAQWDIHNSPTSV
jgi:hypothetical protein